MASNPSPSTSTFIEEGQGTKQQKQHGSSDVTTTSAHSYVVPKYVTDVAALIATSAESRQLFLTEVTRACLEAAKKEKKLKQTKQMHHSWYNHLPIPTQLLPKQFTALLLMEIHQSSLLQQPIIHQVPP